MPPGLGFAVAGNVLKAQSGVDLVQPTREDGLQGLGLEAVEDPLEVISTAIGR